MSKFMDRMMGSLKRRQIIEPTKVFDSSNEVIIGAMNDYEKRIYTYFCLALDDEFSFFKKVEKDLIRVQRKIFLDPRSATQEEMIKTYDYLDKINRKNTAATILKETAFLSIRERLKVFYTADVGLRKGFLITLPVRDTYDKKNPAFLYSLIEGVIRTPNVREN